MLLPVPLPIMRTPPLARFAKMYPVKSMCCLPAIVIVLALAGSGCRKKVAQAPPPPPPPVISDTAAGRSPEPALQAPKEEEAPSPAAKVDESRAAIGPSFGEELSRLLEDVHFDYDRYDIRTDSLAGLTRNARALHDLFERFPSGRVKIEGHADERGSAEYNLGLADRRAAAAREFLAALKVPEDRLTTISLGKERPQCTDQHEGCWQRNRRVHFHHE